MGNETAATGSDEPVRSYAYRLTWLDALVWETLPSELRGWRKFLSLLWLALAGVWLAMLPERWTGPEHSWRWWLAGLILVAIQYGLLTLAMNLFARRRARKRIPVPVDVALEEWGDRLREVCDGKEIVILPDMIVSVPVTDRHVFVATAGEVIIVPLTAFEDRQAMGEFAERWDDLSRNAAE